MIYQVDLAQAQESLAIRVMALTMTPERCTTVRGWLHLDERHPASS